MRTAYETDAQGVVLRVFHRGDEPGEKSWTHPLAERPTCSACQKGTLPPDVQAGRKRSV